MWRKWVMLTSDGEIPYAVVVDLREDGSGLLALYVRDASVTLNMEDGDTLEIALYGADFDIKTSRSDEINHFLDELKRSLEEDVLIAEVGGD